jgi:1-deoxy-D-xylulose-5-phosphate synthase
LTRARDFESRPTIVHVITKKGKGYPAAEADATKYHGISPSCAKPNGNPSYSQIFGQTIIRLMKENPKVVAITAAMIDGTGLAAAKRQFPDRVIDVGICEQHAVTLAAGLATQGFMPVVAVYSTFLQRAYDQIIHDVCMQELPVVFAIDRAGIVGDDGRTHQGPFDISYLRAIPGMVVCAPKDENELQHLLFTAIGAGGPIAVRYPRGCGSGLPLDLELLRLPIGKGELLRSGSDAAILAIGSSVYPALEAASLLESRGVNCSVANARFAKPVDVEMVLDLADRIGRLITVEENALAGGFGSGVLEVLAAHRPGKAIRVETIGIPDRFVEHGPQELFRSMFDLDAEGIARRLLFSFPELLTGASASGKGGRQ